jgi:DNA topoisomerase-2
MKDKVKDKESNSKRLSVERIYQRKSQLEHILLRPDTYIGSIEMETKVRIFYNFFQLINEQ